MSFMDFALSNNLNLMSIQIHSAYLRSRPEYESNIILIIVKLIFRRLVMG